MTEPRATERTIFLDAIEIESIDGRLAFVEKACGDHHELRQRVIDLLSKYGSSGDLLDLDSHSTNAVDLLRSGEASSSSRSVPAAIDVSVHPTIGCYKLLDRLGEGGMGEVYVAEQRQPLKRTVALKLIKYGMDSREVIARFEAERLALSLMNHPNIARVIHQR